MNGLKNKGAVLITSLVMLVILTMLGISAMQDSSLEERMAGNMRSQNIAFQATEAALRAGEADVAGWTTQPQPTKTGAQSKVWILDSMDPDAADNNKQNDNDKSWWQELDSAWWENNSLNIGKYTRDLNHKAGEKLTDAPRYVLEDRETVKDSLNIGQQNDYIGKHYYQITARGTDETSRTEVLLRSTFTRRF